MGLSFAPRAEISEFFPAATCIFAPALLLCGGLIVYSFLGDQHDAAASAKLLHYDLLLYAVHAFYALMYAVELSHADWDLVALVLLICGRRVVFQVSRASVRWPAADAPAGSARSMVEQMLRTPAALAVCACAYLMANACVFLAQLSQRQPGRNILLLFYPLVLQALLWWPARGSSGEAAGDFEGTMNQLLYHSSEAAYYIAFIPAEFVDHEEHLADFRLSRYLIFIIFTNSFVVLAAQAAERHLLSAPAPSAAAPPHEAPGYAQLPLYHRAKYQLRHFAGVYWRDPDQLRLGLVVAQGAVTSALVVVFALATTWRRMALELLLNLGIWQVVLQMPPLAEVRLARAWTPT